MKLAVRFENGGYETFDDVAGFSTEDQYNNLCIWGDREKTKLLAVYAHAKWISVVADKE